jgi:hypothetical protein
LASTARLLYCISGLARHFDGLARRNPAQPDEDGLMLFWFTLCRRRTSTFNEVDFFPIQNLLKVETYLFSLTNISL